MSDNTSGVIEKTELLPFFPTLVWKAQLTGDYCNTLNAKVLDKVAQIVAKADKLPSDKVQQTSHTLYNDPELADLCDLIVAGAKNFLQMTQLPSDNIVITGLWANIAGKGIDHKAHSHPNNYFSGTYYVKTPPGGNRITFHDPRPQPGIIAPQPLKLSSQNAGKITLDIGPGALLLWPSWLRHSVPPNSSDEDRVTVSFNLMFAGYTETRSRPMLQTVVDSL